MFSKLGHVAYQIKGNDVSIYFALTRRGRGKMFLFFKINSYVAYQIEENDA